MFEYCFALGEGAPGAESWSFDRIPGEAKQLAHRVSDATIGNILKRNGMEPAPTRRTKTWKRVHRRPQGLLAATDFFTGEVWTRAGLVTHYASFFIHVASRGVRVAGITPHPTVDRMTQLARNETTEDWGFLAGARLLLSARRELRSQVFQGGLRPPYRRTSPQPIQGLDPARLPHQKRNRANTERLV